MQSREMPVVPPRAERRVGELTDRLVKNTQKDLKHSDSATGTNITQPHLSVGQVERIAEDVLASMSSLTSAGQCLLEQMRKAESVQDRVKIAKALAQTVTAKAALVQAVRK